ALASGGRGVSKPNKPFTPASPPNVAVSDTPKTKPALQSRLRESYGKLPLSFEANQGQMDSEVKFLSRGNGYSLFLTSTEAVLLLPMRRQGDKESERNLIRTTPSQTLASSSSANAKS